MSLIRTGSKAHPQNQRELNHNKWLLRLYGLTAALVLIWLAIAAYRHFGYYQGFLSANSQKALLYLASGYSLYVLIFFTLANNSQLKQSKALLTATALKKILIGIGRFVKTGPRDYTHPLSKMSKAEKRALLFALVKFIFIPMMINFLFNNYEDFRQNIASLGSWGELFSVKGFNDLIYPLLFSLFLLIDAAFFAFGYFFEAGFLKSSLRSVEPTVLGWFVALVCYPPFNGLLGNFVPWYANDYASFTSLKATFFMRLVGLVFMGVYASASVALGPKASNLTNRGIVGYGPYRVVRHPAYISKNLAWWLTIIPVLSPAAVLSMAVWSSIYFMRAITEERHLSADPDYLAYCQNVRYRFIPGLV
jgi:protein-S-isoprenylcysteine O-methyltransferase Ste14